MKSRFLFSRRKALLDKDKEAKVLSVDDNVVGLNPASKTVYAYVNGKLVGQYDSITKCADILGMTRAMVKKVIDNGVVLDNGFLLTLIKY